MPETTHGLTCYCVIFLTVKNNLTLFGRMSKQTPVCSSKQRNYVINHKSIQSQQSSDDYFHQGIKKGSEIVWRHKLTASVHNAGKFDASR